LEVYGDRPHGRRRYPKLSVEDRDRLYREFYRTDAMELSGPDPRRMAQVRLCRGRVHGQYALQSLRNAALVVIGRYRGEIVGLMTVFRPEQIHPDEQKPYCLPHELYVDVVCSYACPRGCGGHMIAGFIMHARTVERVKALRLHATVLTRQYWTEKWHFKEAETIVRQNGSCAHGPVEPHHYEYEDRYGIPRTYRMTRLM
jgi:hypothetical protein